MSAYAEAYERGRQVKEIATKLFSESQKQTSILAAYVDDGTSVKAHLDVQSQADASLLLETVEDWRRTLTDIVERGRL
jgi:hypothetical protein